MPSPIDDVALRHLARVVESSDDAIVSKDLNGTILSWNRAAERMFGYTAQEAIGRSIRMIIPADRQAEEDMVLTKIRGGESITHFETIRQRKDGTLMPISLTVSPIHDDAGRVVGASKIARDITDRSEAALANRRLAAIVESSDDAIISTDLHGIIRSWNRAAERMFGYPHAEAMGQSIRLILPVDRHGEDDGVPAPVRAGEGVTPIETLRQRKNGALIPVSLTISPIYDTVGQTVGASTIARDISERAQAAIAKRRLAAVVESSDDAIITKDLTSVITSWNRAAEAMFGYTEAEALGRSIRMLIPAELQHEEDMVLAKIRAGEKVDHYETIRQRKDGTRLTVALTISPLRNERGEIVGASKVARDVTERARLLAVAREQAANTERLSAVGAVVASTLDRETIVQKVTDIARELTGAQFGAFFYNVTDAESGDAYMLYTLSGARARRLRPSPIRVRRPCSRRPSMAKGPSDWTMSRRIHGTATARRITACRQDTSRSGAIWRSPSRVSPATCWGDCSSGMRTSACLPSSTSVSRWASRRGPRWHWKTRACTWRRRRQTG
jgi:PAS domain S-box-containing protein